MFGRKQIGLLGAERENGVLFCACVFGWEKGGRVLSLGCVFVWRGVGN